MRGVGGRPGSHAGRLYSRHQSRQHTHKQRHRSVVLKGFEAAGRCSRKRAAKHRHGCAHHPWSVIIVGSRWFGSF